MEVRSWEFVVQYVALVVLVVGGGVGFTVFTAWVITQLDKVVRH